MKRNKPRIKGQTTFAAFEEPASHQSSECYVLFLYVAGLTPRSTLAIERIQTICNRFLAGRYELTIVDLYLRPEAAKEAQVVVVPTLVRKIPTPMRMFIGDMTDEKKILQGLRIVA